MFHLPSLFARLCSWARGEEDAWSRHRGQDGAASQHPPPPLGDDLEDIDPDDPEANRAATRIQAAFRGHKSRSMQRSGAGEAGPAMAGGAGPSSAQLAAEFSPQDTELCQAATKIQASFRGHMARKQAPGKGKADEDLSRELQKLDAKAEEEELDIDLNDPDLHKAATKIQASFRGHKVRKETEAKDGEGSTEAASQ